MSGARTTPSRAHRWLLVLPFIWQAGLAPFVDDVALKPFSLPFPMFWQMAGVVFTTFVIAIVYRIDARIDARRDGTTEGPPA